MAQPSPYTRAFDFEAFQSTHPSTPLPGDKVDGEFDAVEAVVSEILNRLAILQRDDLQLGNRLVGYDQLKDELRHGFSTPSVWAGGTSYVLGQNVYVGRKVYAALKAHTASSNFNADYLAGDWYLLADFTAVTAVDQAAQQSATAAAASALEAATSAGQALVAQASATSAAAAAAASAASIAIGNYLDKATYDPTGVGSNAFSMANMAEGADAKIMTSAERATLANATLNDASDVSGNTWVLDEDDMASDSATKVPTQQSVNVAKLQKVADRTSMAALDQTKHKAAMLYETIGRGGLFAPNVSDLSAAVAKDGLQGLLVPFGGDPTGASGAWERILDTTVTPLMWGADPTGGTDSTDAINQALASGKDVYRPAGNYSITDTLLINTNQQRFQGPGIIYGGAGSYPLILLDNCIRCVVDLTAGGIAHGGPMMQIASGSRHVIPHFQHQDGGHDGLLMTGVVNGVDIYNLYLPNMRGTYGVRAEGEGAPNASAGDVIFNIHLQVGITTFINDNVGCGWDAVGNVGSITFVNWGSLGTYGTGPRPKHHFSIDKGTFGGSFGIYRCWLPLGDYSYDHAFYNNGAVDIDIVSPYFHDSYMGSGIYTTTSGDENVRISGGGKVETMARYAIEANNGGAAVLVDGTSHLNGTLGNVSGYIRQNIVGRLDIDPAAYIHMNGGNPEFVLGASSYFAYDRTSQRLVFILGGTTAGYIDTSGFHNGAPA